MPRYQALQRQWAKIPPLRRMIGWHFGLPEKSSGGQSAKDDYEDFASFFSEMTGEALKG